MDVRHLDYGSRRIDFSLNYADRKTLGITVDPDRSVRVVAPLNTPLDKVYEKVRKRAAWILRQQRFFLSFEPRTPPRRYVSGETHLYLGRQYRLRVIAGEPTEEVKLNGGFFRVRLSEPDTERVGTLLRAWYQRRAEIMFPRIAAPYLRRFARLNAVPTDFVVRPLTHRWGSCTAGGRIVLNTELIQAPRGCVEYVIVHELCHLIHPDHGRGFQRLLAEEFPDWRRWKKILEEILA